MLMAPVIHAGAEFGFTQHAREGEAGELYTVFVEDFGLAEPGQRFLQRCDAEVGIHRVRQPLGQHFASRPDASGHRSRRHTRRDWTARLPVCATGGDRPVLRMGIARAWSLVNGFRPIFAISRPRPATANFKAFAPRCRAIWRLPVTWAVQERRVDHRVWLPAPPALGRHGSLKVPPSP
jgi:hypothetical protein